MGRSSRAVEIAYNIKSRGFFQTLQWIKNGFFSYNIFHVYYLDLKKTHQVFPYTVSGLEIRHVSLDELIYLRGKNKNLPVEFFCDQTNGFSTPFLATFHGNIAGIYWLVFPSEYSRFLNMVEGDVELNYNTVIGEFRGKRIAHVMMDFIIQWAKKEGYRRMFGVVNATNIAQFKPMLDLGFRPVEVLAHFLASRPKATFRYVPQ